MSDGTTKLDHHVAREQPRVVLDASTGLTRYECESGHRHEDMTSAVLCDLAS